jgi:hypothetical protein
MTVLLIFLLYQGVDGQSDENVTRDVSLPKFIPASPEAAALGKFGDVPVSNYRGTPDISIPLFSVQEGSISLPITLDYQAGAIKVEEMATNCGLGWVLNGGGVITRVVKGLPDENGYFSSYNAVYRYTHGLMTASETQSFWLAVYHKSVDAEPDNFFFNFAGISGKFFCAEDGRLYCSPRSDLKIEFNTGGNVFTITDGKGIRYSFNNAELTTTEVFCGGDNEPLSSVYTAWYLTSITDPNGNTVNLTYTAVGSAFRTKSVTTKNTLIGGTAGSCPESFSDCYNQVSISKPAISEIMFSNGKIKFVYNSSQRLDASDYALKSVSMLDLNNQVVKSYNLYTGYFATSRVGGCDDNIPYRLRLDSVQEIGSGNLSKPSYKFAYNTIPLPCRLSNAQDHWGYYNGKDNSVFVPYRNALNGPWIGADKRLDTFAVKAGTLEAITYPTGGRTAFTYENNYYSYLVPEGFDKENPVPFSGLSGSNGGASNYFLSYQTNFTISQSDLPPPGYLYFTVDYTTTVSDPVAYSSFIGRLTGDNGYDKILNNGDLLQLTPGHYTLTASIETEFAGNPLASFDLKLNQFVYYPDRYLSKPYGGIRIKQIQNFNESDELTDEKTFLYNAFDVPGLPVTACSADFQGLPDYSWYTYTSSSNTAGGGSCLYQVYNSLSNYPLFNTGASPVGYRNVTILNGPGGKNGKQEYVYTSYTDYPDNVSHTPPFYFASESDWRRGALVKNTDYKYENGAYIPVQKKLFLNGGYSDDTYKISRGIVLGGVPPNGVPDNQVLLGLKIASYNLDAAFFSVLKDTTIVYDQQTPSRFQQVINAYDYNRKNFQLQRKITSANSKNEVITQNFKYPLDYTALSTDNTTGKSIYTLQSKNVISVPIEQYSTRIKNGVEYVMNGKLFLYKNETPVIDVLYNLETNGTTLMSNFQSSGIDGNNNLTFNAAYTPRLIYDKYTTKGMIAEINKQNDSKTVYVWDYKGLKTIAEVKNADLSSIAYTSFEADGIGNWDVIATPRAGGGVTGKQCYQLSNGAIVKNNLNASTVYKLSYWSTAGSYTVTGSTGSPVQGKTAVISGVSWTYYEHQVTGVSSITILGNGNIDELRLYPKSALMQTFTYDPLVGATSQCDARNNIVYFEYDGLTRLLRIRDADKKILKQYDYQYQVTSYAASIWSATGNTRCKPCDGNANYITNIQQREEKDINPYSTNTVKTRWVDVGISSSCVITPDWQYTGNSTCLKNSGGTNTGVLRREQRDINPCSTGQTRYVDENNSVACPLTCLNCTAADKKCINGVCVTGQRVCYESVYDSSVGMFINFYHYVFSDGSSSDDYTEYSFCDCDNANCL